MIANRRGAFAAAAVLVGSVLAANALTDRYGFIPVGFGEQATAGTLAAGAALAARDAVQDLAGKAAVFGLIVLAAALSYAIAGPTLALASAAAFVVAELVDFAVYTPIRTRARFGDRRWTAAVLVSGAAGALLDTVVFIGIAFGWAVVMPAVPGQLVGKLWAALAFVAIGKAVLWFSTSRIRQARKL
ncbi:VUT family protein [Nocardia salmonicida]|uniref:VUT family protein n=1 Tax=Nocardia salmonicida TaxID=53431 RepID=UPI00362A0729